MSRPAPVAGAAMLAAGFRVIGRLPGVMRPAIGVALPALKAGGATYDPWFHLPLMLGDYLGEYALGQILNKAEKTQKDFAYNEAYGGNKIDIGEFNPSLGGILSKAPTAINVGLFQPYIWKSNNLVMAFAGLENLALLIFSLYVLFKVRLRRLLTSLFSHPLFIFSFLFALFFAFSVGLTTANYGALVRLRIPCMPFYLTALIILLQLKTKQGQIK